MQQATMKDTNMQYALTGGAAARELELQKSLQQLLNRYNKAGTPGSLAAQFHCTSDSKKKSSGAFFLKN